MSFILAAAFSFSAFAQLPRHEVTIDAFGGISQLNYKLEQNFAGNEVTMPMKLGGGFGVGYTYLLAPRLGLRTGVEAAIYRGEFTAAKNLWIFHYIDGNNIHTLFLANYTTAGLSNSDKIKMNEIQNVFSVQLPLMLQFITPINEQQSNHFYIALGPRFLFNVAGNYRRSIDGYQVELAAGQQAEDGKTYGQVGWGSRVIPDFETPHIPPQFIGRVGQQGQQLTADDYISSGIYLAELIQPQNSKWEDISGTPQDEARSFPGLSSKGGFKPKLFNLMLSGELGFRWKLSTHMALYTGIYADYGLFSMVPAHTADFINVNNTKAAFADKSVLESRFDNIEISASDAGNNYIAPKVNNHGRMNIASRLGNLGAGLKLRLAFGAAPKSREPEVIYIERIRRDTVYQNKTRTVRDTVYQNQNKIIHQKETVRDTVVIVKEVPVDIQKTMMELSNTMFDFDKYVIKEAAKGPLDKVVKWLQENPDIKVEVAGHTDFVGSEEYNQTLSENRAKAVYNYFISKGVSKSRLNYVGYGKTRPIATNKTDEGRAQNRRVELTIIQ